MPADTLVLILEFFRGSFYAHDVGSEIDNIFPALPSIFLRAAKEQRTTAKGVHELVRPRGTGTGREKGLVLTIDTSPAAAQLGLAVSKGQLHRRKREQRWTR